MNRRREFTMRCFESGTVVSLAPREVVTLPDARGAVMRVMQGTLWVTQHGSAQDVVLRGGDNWVVERNGATVVEAQNDAVFCVAGKPGAEFQRAVAGPRSRARVGTALKRWLHATRRAPVPYF
ncbi:MAG TPA: DUF2917 domain-containing protein [Candidatus Tumulicola sp.]|nr:DUF2917 domain-containing protein [Candidatus Tumulicola sp.]